ncbi:HGxxPAAW family protein [Streptomyces sp. NPDC046821]|uniref:HGxxPAAW family protein n=1 Tax=Streptomyces sp. NPDC046821 TaxID=3154702 RepID=UPI0033D79B55
MDSSHGHTPAAWTGVIIAFVGFCVAGAFTVMGNAIGFWVGIALLAVAAAAGGAMRMAGLGKPKAETLPSVASEAVTEA